MTFRYGLAARVATNAGSRLVAGLAGSFEDVADICHQYSAAAEGNRNSHRLLPVEDMTASSAFNFPARQEQQLFRIGKTHIAGT
jgi:hypothetical protein